MAIQQPSGSRLPDSDALELLHTLLDAPPAASSKRRPTSWRRSRANTWFDQMLKRAQLALIVSSLLVFGYWFVDGPVRDWLHDRLVPPVIIISPAVIALASDASATAPNAVAALRSAKVEAPLVSPENEFIAPRQGLAVAPAAVGPQPTHLIMPSIRVDTPVKEVFVIDDEWQVADYAAGYLHGTGLPGDPGNMVMAGHAGLLGGVFRDLGSLAAGADIYVDAAGWRYRYRVRESKVIWPNQIEVLDPTTTATLTLLTCTNWDLRRLVVIADLLSAKPI